MENIQESTLVVKKLTAAEGFYLTQTNLAEDEERVFTKVAFLAQEQPADHWREATETEKHDYLSNLDYENNI